MLRFLCLQWQMHLIRFTCCIEHLHNLVYIPGKHICVNNKCIYICTYMCIFMCVYHQPFSFSFLSLSLTHTHTHTHTRTYQVWYVLVKEREMEKYFSQVLGRRAGSKVFCHKENEGELINAEPVLCLSHKHCGKEASPYYQ